MGRSTRKACENRWLRCRAHHLPSWLHSWMASSQLWEVHLFQQLSAHSILVNSCLGDCNVSPSYPERINEPPLWVLKKTYKDSWVLRRGGLCSQVSYQGHGRAYVSGAVRVTVMQAGPVMWVCVGTFCRYGFLFFFHIFTFFCLEIPADLKKPWH